MELIFEALILGLIGGAVPGPILTGTFTEILANGFKSGCRVVVLALFAETIGALIALYILYTLGLSIFAIKIISTIGAIVLFWLAWNVWKVREINVETKQILSFPKILLLTTFNSGYWLFWITIGIPKAILLDSNLFGGKFIFLALFELSWLIMTLTLAYIFYKFRPILLRKNLVGITFKILSLILILLGIRTLLSIF